MICTLYAYIGCIAVSCSVDVLVQDTLVGFYSLVVIEYIHWVLSRLFNFISSIWLVQSLSLSLLPPGTHLRASVSCQEAWDCHGWCWKSQSRKVSRRHGEFKPQITSTCHGVLDCRVWKYVEVSIFSHIVSTCQYMSCYFCIFCGLLQNIMLVQSHLLSRAMKLFPIFDHLSCIKNTCGGETKATQIGQEFANQRQNCPPHQPFCITEEEKKRLIYTVFVRLCPWKMQPATCKEKKTVKNTCFNIRKPRTHRPRTSH